MTHEVTVGSHDAECASQLIELQQRIRVLEAEASARQEALIALNASLVAAQSDVEHLRAQLKLLDEAVAPAEARAAALQQQLDRRPGVAPARALYRIVRAARRRLGPFA